MPYPDDFINKVICGDALETMKGIPDGVIQCCVTSPPYWGLRDYGVEGQYGLEKSPEEYVAKMVEVFREVRRVLKSDGTVWINLGDSYAGSGRGRDADGTWNPGQGGSKQATNVGSTIGRQVNSKSLSKNLIEKGVIGNAWVKPPRGLKPKDLCMIPARVALALQADGWYLRSVIIWNKPSCMPESVTDRPTTAHEYVYLLAKSADYYCDMDAIREPFNYPERTYSPHTEHHKTAKLKEQGNRSTAGLHDGRTQYGNPDAGRNKRTVWTINPEPTPYAHFATFPQKLVEPCIMAGTSEKGNCGKCGKPWVRVVEKPQGMTLTEWRKSKGLDVAKQGKGAIGDSRQTETSPQGYGGEIPRYYKEVFGTVGPPPRRTTGWQASCECNTDPVPAIVLDPFSGSGTVGVVAKRLQRKYVLIDLSAEYNEIAEDRLRQTELAL